jgi:toxin CcdB
MQCEVHENADDDAGHMPYLMDVQSNLLSDLATRVVVPLVRSTSFGRPATRLHPVFTVQGQQVVMATHLLAAVRRGTLGTRIMSLLDHRDLIVGAIDVLWSGV